MEFHIVPIKIKCFACILFYHAKFAVVLINIIRHPLAMNTHRSYIQQHTPQEQKNEVKNKGITS